MKYVYVKDSEGFVCKKELSKVASGETIITEQEYKELSGENYYEQKFGHGGARPGAGRKPMDGETRSVQMRVTESEKEFLLYARANKIDIKKLMES